MLTNTKNTPIEALERAYPLRVRRLRIRQGSGGAGRFPGGDEQQAERLPDKCTLPLRPGDVVRIATPGGGGWGRPPDPT